MKENDPLTFFSDSGVWRGCGCFCALHQTIAAFANSPLAVVFRLDSKRNFGGFLKNLSILPPSADKLKKPIQNFAPHYGSSQNGALGNSHSPSTPLFPKKKSEKPERGGGIEFGSASSAGASDNDEGKRILVSEVGGRRRKDIQLLFETKSFFPRSGTSGRGTFKLNPGTPCGSVVLKMEKKSQRVK